MSVHIEYESLLHGITRHVPDVVQKAEQTEVPQHIIVIIAAKYLLHDNIPYRTVV